MGRKPKKPPQTFSFPSNSESVSPLESTVTAINNKTASLEKDAAEKKEIQKAANSIPEIFTPGQVAFVFDVYAIVISLIFSLILKCEFKPIHEELKFEDDEKLAFAQPLAKVASKYAPSSWAGMQPEIELITTVSIYTVAKFKSAQGVAEKIRLEKERLAQQARNPQSTQNRPVAVQA